jgi:glycine C-acetyltransferase/8-amino-7-oxononanoate synthase
MQNWQQEIAALEAAGMRRSLKTVDGQGPHVGLEGREVLLLCSNNYLGIADHPALVEAAVAATRKYGAGSGASRLVSGTMIPHHLLEERLADFKLTAAALLFNSGYAANTGILQGLFGPDDLIFSDALNHASIIDGCRLCRARTVVYPHADAEALRELMDRERPRRKGRWLIVTDGVFSMDGDLAPLDELCAIKEANDALLMVDDAHGTGVLGEHGRGTGEMFGCLDKIDLHMGTLGKGLGCAGAYLASSRAAVEILINRSRPFIFSTSLPPAVPAAALAALDLVEGPEGGRLRQRLESNRLLFSELLAANGLDLLGSCTQIVPVLTHDPGITMAMSQKLLQRGIFLQGIRPPTVPEGSCRLRATVMATHSAEELRWAAQEILKVVGEVTAC